MSPTSKRPSTNSRSPAWVGARPAEACGEASSPACVNACMVLRIEAGDRSSPARDRVCDPTGSPVSR